MLADMAQTNSLQQLKQALKGLHVALETLESALVEFEEGLNGGGAQHPESGTRFELLTIEDVCQELGMGKSWVYKRLKSAEIPSVKLGHNIKVQREDLERYLENNCYRPSGQEG